MCSWGGLCQDGSAGAAGRTAFWADASVDQHPEAPSNPGLPGGQSERRECSSWWPWWEDRSSVPARPHVSVFIISQTHAICLSVCFLKQGLKRINKIEVCFRYFSSALKQWTIFAHIHCMYKWHLSIRNYVFFVNLMVHIVETWWRVVLCGDVDDVTVSCGCWGPTRR